MAKKKVVVIPYKQIGRPTNRPTVEELAEVYAKCSLEETAELYGVAKSTVRNWITAYRKEAKAQTGTR